MSDLTRRPVVVTGANGLVGFHVCAALVERGTPVRALVRRAGSAPALDGVTELVGDFTDPDDAGRAVDGATAVVTTVHPMGAGLGDQRAIGVEGTRTFTKAAAAAGVGRLVHISTAAVYDRSPGVGDVPESGALVGDDAGDYAVTKRETEAAVDGIGGLTRVLLRPPAILGAGASSVWNTLRPEEMRREADARRAVPDQSFPWVHVDDLASLAADIAAGAAAGGDDASRGPVVGGCTALNVAGEPATLRQYIECVTGALGVDPVWQDEPAWTGRLVTDRAHGWGWSPRVTLDDALRELAAGLRSA